MKILLLILIILFLFVRYLKQSKDESYGYVFEADIEADDRDDFGTNDLDEYIRQEEELEKKFEEFIDINRGNNVPSVVQGYRKHNAKKKLKDLVESYFNLHDMMREAKSEKDYSSLIQFCQLGLSLIEPFIVEQKHSYGSFDIRGIPAIEEVLPHYAVIGAKGQIENIKDIVCFFPELAPWKEHVANAERMRDVASEVYSYVKDNPDTIQKDLKKYISEADGRYISNVVYYMALHNIVLREKKGNSYKLQVNTKK